MYAKGKGSTVPSDAQAREKLALYVYEYLLHVGATKAAQTFLSEIRWEKNITLGEPPGFLHSWWCVFWDLYCAAPERRDTCEHSSEAKAFHDYGFVNSGYGVNGIGHNAGPAPPNDGMGGGGMPPGFFPNSPLRPSPPAPHPGSQPSPHGPQPQLMGTGQPFIGPWYSGGGPRGAVRMGMGNDFNGPPGQGMMGNSLGGHGAHEPGRLRRRHARPAATGTRYATNGYGTSRRVGRGQRWRRRRRCGPAQLLRGLSGRVRGPAGQQRAPGPTDTDHAKPTRLVQFRAGGSRRHEVVARRRGRGRAGNSPGRLWIGNGRLQLKFRWPRRRPKRPNRIGSDFENKGKHAGGGQEIRERSRTPGLFYAVNGSFSKITDAPPTCREKKKYFFLFIFFTV